MEVLVHNLKQGMMITIFVFVMMVFIDYINVLTKGKMSIAVRGGLFRQYIMAGFLGATPGCLGAFMNVSFYVHGLISFGAVAGGMIATSGDESFVMLAMFPAKAILLFGILFVLGIISAYFIDKIMPILKIKPSLECQLLDVHPEDGILSLGEIVEHIKKISLVRFLLLTLLVVFIYGFTSGIIGPKDWNWERITFVLLLSLTVFMVITMPEHYLEEHIWGHTVKEHLWRVFLWSFGALLVVDLGLRFWNLETFVKEHIFWVFLIASLIGVIPESGPHLIFVMMFARGLVPFSVLLASSIVQDGHGMLPLLSYSVRDSILMKLFSLLIGLGIGLVLWALGL
ncbi:MAG: selenocysteine protein [Armatimonadetes bacterium CG07_land_8_20_14_0_80_40_9]|nr:MAG: selenocysteine protein [Armatimonadetes bacterium CG07_land_8_20_14_0_80_40_9]